MIDCANLLDSSPKPRYDCIMINNTNRDMIAAIIFNSYYFDDSIDALLIASTLPTSTPIFDRLIDALDSDIADMLHNANLADLLPYANDLTDADFDALSDALLDDDSYIPMIAELILARSASI